MLYNNDNESYYTLNSLSSNSNSIRSSMFKQYSSIISSLLYFIRETELYIYLKNKKNTINKYFNRKKEKHKLFYLFLDGLDYLDNKQNIDFKQCVINIQSIINIANLQSNNQSMNSNSNLSRIMIRSQLLSSLKDIIISVFDKIIYKYIKKLSKKENKNNKDICYKLNLKEKSSEEEAINNFEEEISKRPKEINDYFNLLLFKLFPVEELKDGKYKIKSKYFFSFEIEKIYEYANPQKEKYKEITLNDCFDYYFEKEEKIYKPPEIMLLIFIIERPAEHKINYSDNKEFEIKLIRGSTVNYKLAGIIYEENDDYFTIISENLRGEKWKKYKSEEQMAIENENRLDYILPQPIILIYRRDEK